jgi:hypothetical protein
MEVFTIIEVKRLLFGFNLNKGSDLSKVNIQGLNLDDFFL